MDVKFLKNAYDVDVIKEILEKGKITAEPDGKVRMVHNLANNVVASLELQVTDLKIDIKND